MTEYVDVFREEAKSLFSAYKNNEQDAVKRCAKMFGAKTDLTLMNIQHVIAKEYGFNQWNDILKAEKWDLAGALNAAQNKRLSSPLHIWYDSKGESYSRPERFGIGGLRGEPFDLVEKQKRCFPYVHINNTDVSQTDFSKFDMSLATFDDWTIWSNDEKKMPKGFNPQEFIEKRKNPGLGIRNLHKMGIDGKGINIALITDSGLRPHIEYRESLADYVDLHKERMRSDGGWEVAILAGKNCGVAPKAKVYCYTVDSRYNVSVVNVNYVVQMTQAIYQICELHRKLLSEGKKGIDVIFVSGFVTHSEVPEEVNEKSQKAVNEAKKLGICVNHLGAAKVKTRALECVMNGDLDNPDDYILHRRGGHIFSKVSEREILCMVGFGQTVPCQYTIGTYLFNSTSDLTKVWECGLFVLCKSVKPSLTLEEFWQLGIETGDFRKGIGVIVNPQRLIKVLKK